MSELPDAYAESRGDTTFIVANKKARRLLAETSPTLGQGERGLQVAGIPLPGN
jgi:hypothetical protein